ncbi:MAG: ribosome maturation factor RimM [Candidatus Korobacteraceae bacterium]
MARVLGPQGRRGEVLAELHTDFPQRFEERRQLSGLAPDGSRRELQLEEHWFHKGGVVLKFAGVDSISDAERLKGFEVQLPREERTELEAGSAYISEIVGCDVWIDGGQRFLGRVIEVQFGAGEAPLLVVRLPICAAPRGPRGEIHSDVLVPYAAEYVTKLDLPEHRIQMQLPEGLLDLDAPLSDEEKRRQKTEADEARSAGESGRK